MHAPIPSLDCPPPATTAPAVSLAAPADAGQGVDAKQSPSITDLALSFSRALKLCDRPEHQEPESTDVVYPPVSGPVCMDCLVYCLVVLEGKIDLEPVCFLPIKDQIEYSRLMSTAVSSPGTAAGQVWGCA